MFCYKDLEGELLLFNSSESHSLQPGYSIGFVNRLERIGSISFFPVNVTVSQSGDYRVDGWKNRSLIEQKSWHYICPTEASRSVGPPHWNDRRIGLCESNSTAKDLTNDIAIQSNTFVRTFELDWYLTPIHP